jgi:hypothetical protein
MNGVKKVTALFFAMACASGPNTPRPESNGYVPLVQIQNDHYSEAVVFVEGARLTEIRGGTHALVLLPIARIPADVEIRFTVRLRALDQSIQLPVVQYRPGRAVRIILKPLPSASIAWE